MMEIIPTCRVYWDEGSVPDVRGNARVMLRVPENRVEALVSVLLFNQVAWFDVVREDSPTGLNMHEALSAVTRNYTGPGSATAGSGAS